MKLVKDAKVVKLPKSGRSVKDVLRQAEIHAQAEGWTRVIVIGESKTDCRSLYSKMDRYTSIGILTVELVSCTRDFFKD